MLSGAKLLHIILEVSGWSSWYICPHQKSTCVFALVDVHSFKHGARSNSTGSEHASSSQPGIPTSSVVRLVSCASSVVAPSGPILLPPRSRCCSETRFRKVGPQNCGTVGTKFAVPKIKVLQRSEACKVGPHRCGTLGKNFILPKIDVLQRGEAWEVGPKTCGTFGSQAVAIKVKVQRCEASKAGHSAVEPVVPRTTFMMVLLCHSSECGRFWVPRLFRLWDLLLHFIFSIVTQKRYECRHYLREKQKASSITAAFR